MEKLYNRTISLEDAKTKEAEQNIFDATREYGDSLIVRQYYGQENPARIVQFNDCYLIISMFDNDMTVKFIKGNIEKVDKTIGV